MWLRAALAACLLASAVRPVAPPQSPVYRSGTRTVSIYATVQDGDRLVTDLPQSAFEIRDNGRVQPITLFDNGVQPISVVVMLDVSGSMLGNLALVRNAAVQMFTRLLREDKARVGAFGDRITISPTFTNDQDELIRALWLDLPAGGATPLYAAIDQSMTALARVDGRRVVLVLSDGKDSGPSALEIGLGRRPVVLETVMRRAQEEEFTIYAIGLHSRSAGRSRRGGVAPARGGSEPDPGLRDLAFESGGGYIEIDQTSALGPAFARVADELHRQYLVAYALPDADGKRHDVEVRVDRPGLTVRTRKSYVAPRGR
jgi:VWFA-related protein